jgi:hypothetical protein
VSGTVWSSIWRRSRVVAAGVLVGLLFAAFAAMKITESSFNGYGYVWWLVVAGPVSDEGWAKHVGLPISPVGRCLLALTLLIPAHPIRPNWFTAALTLLGLASWYFQGFLFALLSRA